MVSCTVYVRVSEQLTMYSNSVRLSCFKQTYARDMKKSKYINRQKSMPWHAEQYLIKQIIRICKKSLNITVLLNQKKLNMDILFSDFLFNLVLGFSNKLNYHIVAEKKILQNICALPISNAGNIVVPGRKCRRSIFNVTYLLLTLNVKY